MKADEINYIYLICGIVLGVVLSHIFGMFCALMGWKFKKKPAALSESARKELDFIYEKTGLRAHKVVDQPFNGFIKTAGNPEAEKIQEILYRYSFNGFIFTNKSGELIGRICTITTRADLVASRRSKIKLVFSNKEKS